MKWHFYACVNVNLTKEDGSKQSVVSSSSQLLLLLIYRDIYLQVYIFLLSLLWKTIWQYRITDNN
jgi:hypothetical protein